MISSNSTTLHIPAEVPSLHVERQVAFPSDHVSSTLPAYGSYRFTVVDDKPPSIDVIAVIDTSGSMASTSGSICTKTRLAKCLKSVRYVVPKDTEIETLNATHRAQNPDARDPFSILGADDCFGILTFNGEHIPSLKSSGAKVGVPLTPAHDTKLREETMPAFVHNTKADGGTCFATALKALPLMEHSRYAFVFFLTDGGDDSTMRSFLVHSNPADHNGLLQRVPALQQLFEEERMCFVACCLSDKAYAACMSDFSELAPSGDLIYFCDNKATHGVALLGGVMATTIKESIRHDFKLVVRYEYDEEIYQELDVPEPAQKAWQALASAQGDKDAALVMQRPAPRLADVLARRRHDQASQRVLDGKPYYADEIPEGDAFAAATARLRTAPFEHKVRPMAGQPSITIKEHRSTYPFILGVSLSCVPPSEVTDHGEKYAYTVLPQSQITSQQKVYECNDNVHHGLVWRMQYPEYNHANLESYGVMDSPGQPTIFLHESHPAVGLLRHNADMIGCDVDQLPRLGGVWLNISRQVLKTCCQTLRAKVLSKFHTQDMNMFSLQLHRLNAEAWDDFGDDALASFKPKAKWTPDELDAQKQHHLRQFVTTQYSYVARLEVEFEVPATSPSTTLQ